MQRVRISNLLFLFTALVLGCSLVGLLAPLFWQCDLFNHFRPQALVAGVVLLLAAFWGNAPTRRLALAVILLNAALMGWPLWLSSGVKSLPAHAADTVTVLSSNVLTKNQHYEAVLQRIAEADPDVVVLTETNPTWIEQMQPLHARYPYRFTHPRSDNFGLAVYAKQPFKGSALAIGAIDRPLVKAEFAGWTLLAAHPVPPMSAAYRAENHAYLQEIAAQATASPVPLLVAGDLNSTLWSHSTRTLLRAGLKRINPWGVAYTWPSFYPVLAIQIDHFFAKGITQASFAVLDEVGSDHFPILTKFALPQHP